MRKWLLKISPNRETVAANRLLRPVAHWLTQPSIWHINRKSVARGMAVGLFAGFIFPLGQILMAAILSVVTRSNVIVATGATLVTNPLTVPPLYYLAYRTGLWVLGPLARSATQDAPAPAVQADAGLLAQLLQSVTGATLYTACGLLIFAIGSAILGFLAVHLVWAISHQLRLRRRLLRKRSLA